MKRILALILAISLLTGLSACTMTGTVARTETSQHPTTTAPTDPTGTVLATDEPGPIPTGTDSPADDEALIRWQNGGFRDYRDDVPVDMVPFAEMEYVRPDTEALYAAFDALIEEAEDSGDADALLTDYYAVYDRYLSFYSMDTIANLRHSLDTTDSYFSEEYDWCEAESPNVEEKLETLYKAFAAGPARTDLETAYFGEGFFETYDDYEVYTNETFLAFSKQEKEILSEYRELTADPDGNFDTDAVTDCFIRMVKVRKQMAETLDYDSYAAYAYDVTYGRDYTTEEGSAFLDEIRTEIVPILNELLSSDGLYGLYGVYSMRVSEQEVDRMVQSAAQNIGGAVYDAFRFMKRYDLCDIRRDAKKLDGSFETYIYDYEAPFVMVNATGDYSDYTTFAHEFGHFTDGFYNYGANEDLETAETFSQAMEFLALQYTDTLSDEQKSGLTKLQIIDQLQAFITQAAFAKFEEEVYQLPDEELTPERVNGVFMQVCVDYGFVDEAEKEYYASYWTNVLHFFEVPFYVIAYCVSADNALQVCRLETEHTGDGVDAYFRILDRDHEARVQQFMTDAGLENPFREGGVRESADFIREQLGLKP